MITKKARRQVSPLGRMIFLAWLSCVTRRWALASPGFPRHSGEQITSVISDIRHAWLSHLGCLVTPERLERGKQDYIV